MSDIAWHFVGETLRDGSPIPDIGVPLRFDGPVEICSSGLHASRHPFDALQYAPGNTLCKVRVSEIVDERGDKLVCRERTILSRIDAEPLLRRFARNQALNVIHLWDAPDVVKTYLETGDESKRAAAEAAARAAAWAAARAAARAAAEAAARAAARAAAEDAARAAAREEFLTMVEAAMLETER